jgi:hypothetical protein
METKREQEKSKCEVSGATVRVKKSRFKRNIECKSETLGFVGLYWVELSVCIIPPIIYNLPPPLWSYLILKNHVNLLICVFFVFAFGPVCAIFYINKLSYLVYLNCLSWLEFFNLKHYFSLPFFK